MTRCGQRHDQAFRRFVVATCGLATRVLLSLVTLVASGCRPCFHPWAMRQSARRVDVGPWPSARGGEYDGAMRLTAAITREGEWFVAQCLEVDVASQGRSVEESRVNLAEALALYFEDQDVEIGDAPIIAPIDVAV